MQALQPWRFDEALGSWEECPTSNAGVPPLKSLSLLTWNVWFEEYLVAERAHALLDVVRLHASDILAFQEITPRFLEILLGHKWIRDSYWISDARGSTVDPYGALLLSRIPMSQLSFKPLPSFMGRRLVLGEWNINGRQIRVGSVHLESRKPNAHIRRQQFTIAMQALRETTDAALMGDFNFCSNWEEENDQIPSEYTDLWAKLHPNDSGYTVDSVANRMRFRHKKETKRTRFDRVLLRSDRDKWRPHSIRMLGLDPLPGMEPPVYPSDHFGLVAELKFF